jgi:hypothetical protein
MTTSLIKTIAQTQPAILLATVLAHVSLNLSWPATLAIVLGLQILTLIVAMRRRSQRARNLRFIARSKVVPIAPARREPVRRRPHLSLVP